ncbi:MAG: xanthine dehydrogenase accessory protein XdhC, partial [Gammaproteobacteria bacterium]|nr:xanthine dehydrogenase accessory protein XdhC [Gammaproteobacteria bacterium]
MNEWIDELSDLAAAGERVVLVTVAGIRGSAPREVGAKMIVTGDATVGTIGGGQLEYQCTRIACDMLGQDEIPSLRKFPLGTAMGQCCGGVVDILFEPFSSGLPGWLRDLRALHGQRQPAVIVTDLSGGAGKQVVTADSTFGDADSAVQASIVTKAREGLEAGRTAHRIDNWFFEDIVGTDLNIAVFGAGHVGSAIVQALSGLDCNIRWIDSRRNIFRSTPANVRAIESREPALEVAAMPPQSCYLVMTHSHAIDFDICGRILR